MNYRLTLVTVTGVVILLLLAVIGYTQGWFGEIFGVGFNGGRAAVSDQAGFAEGSFADTEYRDGALQLKTKSTGGSQ